MQRPPFSRAAVPLHLFEAGSMPDRAACEPALARRPWLAASAEGVVREAAIASASASTRAGRWRGSGGLPRGGQRHCGPWGPHGAVDARDSHPGLHMRGLGRMGGHGAPTLGRGLPAGVTQGGGVGVLRRGCPGASLGAEELAESGGAERAGHTQAGDPRWPRAKPCSAFVWGA